MAKTPPSLLSAEWINARLDNVLDQIDGILDNILDDGLLSSGYRPLQLPLTDALLRRMSPEDFEAYSAGLDDAQKAELMQRLAKLEVPWYLAGSE